MDKSQKGDGCCLDQRWTRGFLWQESFTLSDIHRECMATPLESGSVKPSGNTEGDGSNL